MKVFKMDVTKIRTKEEMLQAQKEAQEFREAKAQAKDLVERLDKTSNQNEEAALQRKTAEYFEVPEVIYIWNFQVYKLRMTHFWFHKELWAKGEILELLYHQYKEFCQESEHFELHVLRSQLYTYPDPEDILFAFHEFQEWADTIPNLEDGYFALVSY